MHIHIIGICGTFMAGIAILARQAGMKVTGSDANVYPPMSTQLESLGIDIMQGYKPEHLDSQPDQIVVGNVMTRGMPMVEYILDNNLPYMSGPEWLQKNILQDKWVLGVSGTHGKTTVSSMLAWILEYAGMSPGFLIGGIPQNLGVSARLGDTPFFVIESDEYDTAFFDKRSKFIHYHPRTLVINNLEFDHGDIFDSLDDIERSFHHLIRTVPGNGLVIRPEQSDAIDRVLKKGIWTDVETVMGENGNWQVKLLEQDGSRFEVSVNGQSQGSVDWSLIGEHNVCNGLMAIAAARHVGVTPEHGIAALNQFISPKRRLELLGEFNGISVYDDFAHHPTAIKTTVEGLRKRVGEAKIIAVTELRSNTMKSGYHCKTLAPAVAEADEAWFFTPELLNWDLSEFNDDGGGRVGQQINHIHDLDQLISNLVEISNPGDHILIMSNGGFGGIYTRLTDALTTKAG